MYSILLNILLLVSFKSDYESAVQKYLSAKFVGYTKIEVKLLNDWNRFESIKIIDGKEPEQKGNIVYVPVEYSTEKRKNTATLMAVEIKLFNKVMIANTDIKYGEKLSPEKFDLVSADITNAKEPVADYALLFNKRASEYIKKDEILSGYSFEDMPLISPGDKLTLHASVGSVDVTLSAVSRQEGSVNDIIRVKTQDNKLLKARVLDKINVLIVE